MIKLQPELRQTHSIGQQQIQSLQILSMSAEELFVFAREIAETNCVIDIDSLYDNRRLGGYYSYNNTDFKKSVSGQDDVQSAIDRIGTYNMSLRSFLRQQVKECRYTSEQLRILYTLISRVGDDGMLMTDDPVVEQLYNRAPVQTESMVTCIQMMEPAGVGARSVSERIQIQLRHLPARDTLAELIAEKYLALAANRRFAEISKQTGQARKDVERACELIRNVDPFPAREFCPEKPVCIIPDIVISRGEDGFKIELTRQGMPYIKIDTLYESNGNDYDKNTREYLAAQYSQARMLQKSIEQRNKTLADVAGCIFRRQFPFFLYGERCLNAMRQKQIADELGIHESTVSRAISGKYLQCKWGTFPLKYFFSTHCQSESGVVNPLCVIQELVNGESSLSPVSDDDMARHLARLGVKISRRTVSKYRAQLGIPSAKMRKNPIGPTKNST